MPNSLNKLIKNRIFWLVLFSISLLSILFAIFLQNFKLIYPCLYCVYERVAVIGIALITFTLIFFHKTKKINFLLMLVLLITATKGALLNIEHIQLELLPPLFSACSQETNYFPKSFPLNEWFPSLFKSYGDCSMVKWSFFNIALTHWLLLFFILYILVSIVGLISIILDNKKR